MEVGRRIRSSTDKTNQMAQPNTSIEHVIQDLMKRSKRSRDDIIKDISPEFDIHQWKTSAPTVCVSIHGIEYDVQERLAGIFKLINKYELVCVHLSQHNLYGWDLIIFTANNYKKFVDILLEKARKQCNDTSDEVFDKNSEDGDFIESWEKVLAYPILGRFLFDTRYPNLELKTQRMYTSCSIYCGKKEYEFNVTFEFTPSEIIKLEAELDELFHE